MASGGSEQPIACTLGGNDYRERLAWIAQLNRDGLRSHRRDVMTLELRYAAAVRDRVHQLVKQESECCAFLGFALDESDDQVSVTITVPERAGEIAGDLVAPFLATSGVESEQQLRTGSTWPGTEGFAANLRSTEVRSGVSLRFSWLGGRDSSKRTSPNSIKTGLLRFKLPITTIYRLRCFRPPSSVCHAFRILLARCHSKCHSLRTSSEVPLIRSSHSLPQHYAQLNSCCV
jgi:hypothetical protein